MQECGCVPSVFLILFTRGDKMRVLAVAVVF